MKNELNKEVLKLEFADWVDKLPESEIRRLLRYNPKYYFGGGKPGVLPIETFHKIIEEIIEEERELLREKSSKVLDNYNYGKTEGSDELRTILAQRLQKKENINCSKDDMVISTGSQQILYALNDVLIKPGDIILTTRPTYLGFLMPAEKLGATIVTLPSDENGLLTDFIEPAIELCKNKFGKTPKILYIIPYSDNPKGTTLPEKRKQQIIDIIFPHNNILIIEDAAYKEIQYDNKPYHSLKEHDEDNEKIAYLSTTTKEAASFRLGYSVFPTRIRNAIVKVKGYYDLCTSEFTQKIAARYYEKYIDDQIPKIQREYKLRRDAMVSAVERCMPEGIFTRPTGGFFVWYETKNVDFDSRIYVGKAVKEDISYVPGYSFFPTHGYNITEDRKLTKCKVPRNTLRLGYSLLTPELITEGIELLGEFIKQGLKNSPSKNDKNYIKQEICTPILDNVY